MSSLKKLKHLVLGAFTVTGMSMAGGLQAQQVSLDDIQFVSLPGDRVEIELHFDSIPPNPEVFEIENPARLSMDFSEVANNLAARRYAIESNIADSVTVVESAGRTRMVVNLAAPTSYITRVEGNTMLVTIGDGNAAQGAARNVAAAAAQSSQAATSVTPGAPTSSRGDIAGVDFRRDDNGAGQIVIDLLDNDLIGNIRRSGTSLELEFLNAELDPRLQARLDVTDYATPVRTVDIFSENGSVRVRADIVGEFDYLAYQSGGQYIINVTSLAQISATGGSDDFLFTGDVVNVNFQNIEIRSVLAILAETNDFSLVVSPTVSGNITLRLVNVPWDQALDMVLRSGSLGSRIEGNVMYVAPANEIAEDELQALQNSQNQENLAPLVTEYISVNYAVAIDLVNLISNESGSILSDRGTATVDERTNTLIVQDVATVIDDVREMLRELDVPVRQVLIEARIVNATTSFSDALGIRWGGGQRFPGAGDRFVLTGSQAASIRFGQDIADYNQSVAEAVIAGQPIDQVLATTQGPTPSFPDALVVDLGLSSSPSSIALGYAGNNGLLELELSALEASGNGEVIAQPSVTTQDQQLARIESGLQVPYQAQAGGTAGGSTTEFVPAVLALEVTPQITPDGRIIMLLDISQDSIVPGSGAVPAISTNRVTTRVLVNDGDTVVLGGVFREEVTTTVSKTPLLGDLPYVGNIFKRTENSETKTELLIFITPSIINDLM